MSLPSLTVEGRTSTRQDRTPAAIRDFAQQFLAHSLGALWRGLIDAAFPQNRQLSSGSIGDWRVSNPVSGPCQPYWIQIE
jgi:hypothetical protein